MRPLATLFLLLATCGGAKQRPNILLVTIDTLRPDHVGAGTPALDAFLRESTRFPRARTVLPLTLPAHASMLTGLFPAGHGLHDNATPPLPPRAGRAFPLLAEELRDAGYSTAAFLSQAVMAPAFGLASGFDIYDCPRSGREREDTAGYLPGEERIRAPVAWLEKPPPGKPWFVWVHLYDPHSPYRAFPGDARRAATSDTDDTRARYAGEVRRVDAAFEALVNAAPRDTVVVLCSDHGEGLLDHGEATHGTLCYGSTIDALLAVRGGGFGGRVDPGLRSVADIAPTVRRVCGLPAVPGDGRDLAGPPHETLVAESLMVWSIHGWGQCFAATDGDFTLVESGPRLELFDRRTDPGELSPTPLDLPAYEKLDRALERYRAGVPKTPPGPVLATVTPYAGLRAPSTSYLKRHENAKLRDPRDHVKTWSYAVVVLQLQLMGEARHDPAPLRQILRILADFEAEAGKSPWIDHYRAGALAGLARVTGDRGQLAKAIESELAAIRAGYVARESVGGALAYITDARDVEALRSLVALLGARALDPEWADALGDAKAALGVRD